MGGQKPTALEFLMSVVTKINGVEDIAVIGSLIWIQNRTHFHVSLSSHTSRSGLLEAIEDS